PAREHHAREPDHFFLLHGIAYDRKGLLTDLVGRREVIRAIEVAVVDFSARYKTVDLDRVRTLDLDLFQFLVLDQEVLALGILVAAADILLVDGLPGPGIDHLLLEAVPGFRID